MTADKINHRQPRTVLVACPNWVGDVVMATPTLACIRRNLPAARIVVLIRKYARGVLADAPWFDDLIEIEDKTIGGMAVLVSRLRRLKPDLALILPNSFRAALIARLGGARRIYGYRRNGRTLLMNGGPAPQRSSGRFIPRPMVDYYMEICRWMNFDTPSQSKPRLFYADATQEKGVRLMESYGITPDDMVIGINPGAGFGSSKCWPPEHFARLAEMVSQEWNCKIMLFIGPAEQDIGRRIAALSRAEIITTGPDKVDLALLKPLVQRCRLLFTNDTGPRHYAVAFDVPVVVIMGPTDPRYTQANLEKTIVLRTELPCSPCHRKHCNQNHECMRDILPETALQAGAQLLREHP